MKLNVINPRDFIDMILEDIDKNIFADIEEPVENGITYLEMVVDGRLDELEPDSIIHAIKTLNDFLVLFKKLKNSRNFQKLLVKFNNMKKEANINK